jgi:tetratricopeptide (TPR) repeat protein
LRTWIAPPGEPPYRPYVILTLSATTGMLIGNELLEHAPTADDIHAALFKAMAKPPRIAGPAQRPQVVAVTDRAWVDALAPAFDEIAVQLIERPLPDEVRELIGELESSMNEADDIPGLLSIKGTTPESIGRFFNAAAEFYRAEPWIKLYNSQLLAVRHPAERDYRFVSVMGNGGVEYGLATYPTWQSVEKFFAASGDPTEALSAGVHSLLFNDMTQVPFDDLDALEQYGWEVANDQAYPMPVIFDFHEGARRPSLKDMRWYEAALRAIPIFVRDHLKPDGQGDYQPVETSIDVVTHEGRLKVAMKYPGGILSPEAQPAPGLDWQPPDEDKPPRFDRRAMEGAMWQTAVKELGADAVGTGNRALDQAQQIMYQAWDESNPGKRLTLAHQALSISADCADAWVLLAEDEADTVQRALDYYQNGVEAGKRALGNEYFSQHVGHFWGLLETRPFMRALEGTANLLWNMSRRAEAADAYFDLLRLNPGDNQGVRYSLLNLLLESERIEDARQLLKKYKSDYSSAWTYTRTLLEFRAGGASAKATKALKAALKQNPFVPAYLTGQKRIPSQLPDYIGLGDENEAVDFASSHLNHWRRVPGAVEWLKSQAPQSSPPGPLATPRRRGRR